MAQHVPAPQTSSRSAVALLGRLSPMVCPLAKLGRASPSIDSQVTYHMSRGSTSQQPHQPPETPTANTSVASYHLDPSVYHCTTATASSAQLDQTGYTHLDQGYHVLGRSSPPLDCGFQLRSSPALRRASSPTLDHLQCYHQSADQSYSSHHKLGRSSPSLDQGYHTLVSPSPGPSTPGPWIDPHPPLLPLHLAGAEPPNTGAMLKGKRVHSKTSPFDRLTDEAVIKIFMWLDSSELCVCARVCRRWEHLAWDPRLWRTIKLSGEAVCGDRAIRGVLRRLCGQGRTGACPNVERVFLSDGARVTDRGLTLLARRCPELTHLQLHGCNTVTNPTLFDLATRCSNLQHLDLTGKWHSDNLLKLEL
jgi:F-box/leucine-rich repeat protein 7